MYKIMQETLKYYPWENKPIYSVRNTHIICIHPNNWNLPLTLTPPLFSKPSNQFTIICLTVLSKTL